MIRALPTGYLHLKRQCAKCRQPKPIKGGRMGPGGKGFVCAKCAGRKA